ncbi:MAG: dTMP kinase [Candidatus Micrarchaeota archaeon]
MFIVFEGLDGSGQSTQSNALKDYLIDEKKVDVMLTKEQTDGFIGGLIKAGLKHEWKTSPLGLQLLFVADRAHHLFAEIEPALDVGKIVISDRYIFSTLAFGALGADMDFLKMINSKFRKPDVTFILDTPPEVCLERIKRSRFQHLELFEKIEMMKKIRENYLSLKSYFPNVYIINGNRTKDEIHKEIVGIIEKHMK